LALLIACNLKHKTHFDLVGLALKLFKMNAYASLGFELESRASLLTIRPQLWSLIYLETIFRATSTASTRWRLEWSHSTWTPWTTLRTRTTPLQVFES